MTSTLKYARLLELILYDPIENVKVGKIAKFHSEWYDDKEVETLLLLARKLDEPIYPALYLCAKLGLRRSEAVGCKWSNVDYKNKTLRINCTVIQANQQILRLDTTKNDSSIRDLPLSNKTLAFLANLKKRQDINRKMFGASYYDDDADYMCLWADGHLFKPNLVTVRFKSFLEKHDLKKIRLHDLRHSFCSSLIRSGISVKVVSRLAGHSDIQTTLSIYSHIIGEDLSDALTARDNGIAI